MDKIQDFSIKDIILISSLPDMGKVGGLVSQHLKNQLKSKISSKIILNDKPWVNLKNGIIDLPRDEYSINVDEECGVVIFTGENQPQEQGVVFDIASQVISLVSKIGNIKLIISTGGYLPNQNKTGEKVFGVATNSKTLEFLKSIKINPLSSEVNTITWFNGIILGIAKNQNIDALGLFGEIEDADSSQYRAASNIIKVISKIIKKDIDTSELEKKIPEKKPEPKKDQPGIG